MSGHHQKLDCERIFGYLNIQFRLTQAAWDMSIAGIAGDLLVSWFFLIDFIIQYCRNK